MLENRRFAARSNGVLTGYWFAHKIWKSDIEITHVISADHGERVVKYVRQVWKTSLQGIFQHTLIYGQIDGRGNFSWISGHFRSATIWHDLFVHTENSPWNASLPTRHGKWNRIMRCDLTGGLQLLVGILGNVFFAFTASGHWYGNHGQVCACYSGVTGKKLKGMVHIGWGPLCRILRTSFA